MAFTCYNRWSKLYYPGASSIMAGLNKGQSLFKGCFEFLRNSIQGDLVLRLSFFLSTYYSFVLVISSFQPCGFAGLSSSKKQPDRAKMIINLLWPIFTFVVQQRPLVAVSITTAGKEEVRRSTIKSGREEVGNRLTV